MTEPKKVLKLSFVTSSGSLGDIEHVNLLLENIKHHLFENGRIRPLASGVSSDKGMAEIQNCSLTIDKPLNNDFMRSVIFGLQDTGRKLEQTKGYINGYTTADGQFASVELEVQINNKYP